MIPEVQMHQGVPIGKGQVWRNAVNPEYRMVVLEAKDDTVIWDGIFGGGYRTPLSIFENWVRYGSDWYLTNPEAKDGGRDQAAAAEDGRRDQGDERPG